MGTTATLDVHFDDPPPGATLGRYELVRPVGEGGMARVWLARVRGSHGPEKVVAIKTIRPSLADEPGFREMFLDEARLACGVRHPNVVEVYGLGEEAGVLYLAMEWVEGASLHAIGREGWRRGPFPAAVAMRLGADVLAGLHAAHEACDTEGQPLGIVHRDVSPQNILVGDTGLAKLADFGVAKAVGRLASTTATGLRKGKTLFMAPEQALGTAVDRRGDVFAMGVVLFLLTTGKHPYRGDTDLATLRNLLDVPLPRPSSCSAFSYPPALEAVLVRALARDPAERFATAAEMGAALKAAAREASLEADSAQVAAYVASLFELRAPVVTGAVRASSTDTASETRPRRGKRIVAYAGGALLVAGTTALVVPGRTPLDPAMPALGAAIEAAQPPGGGASDTPAPAAPSSASADESTPAAAAPADPPPRTMAPGGRHPANVAAPRARAGRRHGPSLNEPGF